MAAVSLGRVNIPVSAGNCHPWRFYAQRNTTADIRRPPPGVASQCEGLTIKEESSFPMGNQNPSAPSRVRSRIAGQDHPNRGGLIHDNSRHTARFTVIGNHLAQHAELSLLAIGLGTHIQSLPRGARIDIKTLAARFPEGVARIAAALRELEKHGYLRRERLRVPGGRIVTRTISCNQPGRGREVNEPRPRDARPSPPYPHRSPPPFSTPPPTSSRASAARTAACSSPRTTPPTSPPEWPPGWSATSLRQPYAEPSPPISPKARCTARPPYWPTA